jgi:hypothetical protein
VTKPLRACEVLNWDRLVELSQYIDPDQVRQTTEVFAVSAYAITQTADEDVRDRLLTDILVRAAYGSRPENNQRFLVLLAEKTKSDLELLRRFAKQVGVQLKKSSLFVLILAF